MKIGSIIKKLLISLFTVLLIVSLSLWMSQSFYTSETFFTSAKSIAELVNTGYVQTSELIANESAKEDTSQKNYQIADTNSAAYSTSLIQTAEWTDKNDGKATINIYYSVEFDAINVSGITYSVESYATDTSDSETIEESNEGDEDSEAIEEAKTTYATGVASDVKTITITATISSAFNVSDNDITVTIAGVSTNKLLSYDSEGNTIVTVTITGGDEFLVGDIEISIPVVVKDETLSFSEGNGFASTNKEETKVVVSRTTTLSTSEVQSSGETVSVASPMLYRESSSQANEPVVYYTLTYKANGGDSDGEPSDNNNYSSGDTVTLESGDDSALGSDDDKVVFIGWSLSDAYDTSNPVSDAVTEAGVSFVTSVSFVDADITVYAVWAIDEDNDGVADYLHSITFNAGSYGVVIDDEGNALTTITYEDVALGTSLEDYVPDVVASSSYTFYGWSDSNGQIYSSSTVMSMITTGDMTFTAVYSQSYEGESSSDETADTDDESIELPEISDTVTTIIPDTSVSN